MSRKRTIGDVLTLLKEQFEEDLSLELGTWKWNKKKEREIHHLPVDEEPIQRHQIKQYYHYLTAYRTYLTSYRTFLDDIATSEHVTQKDFENECQHFENECHDFIKEKNHYQYLQPIVPNRFVMINVCHSE